MASNDIKFNVLASVVGAQAIDNLKKSVDGVSGAASGLSKAFKGIGVGAAVAAVGLYVKSIIDMGDELQALSEKTGIASNTLYGFKVAGETANLSMDALSGNLAKFTKNLGGIATGTGEAAKALKAIGVSAIGSNGQLRESGAVLVDVAGKFEKMKDGPEKARLAIALFGKSGIEMIPFLNQGSAALEEFGGAFGPDFAARADAFNDSLAKMKAGVEGFAISAVSQLLPTLKQVTTAFSEVVGAKEAINATMIGIGEAVRLLSLVFIQFSNVVAEVVDSFIVGIREMYSFGKQYLGNLMDALVNYYNTVKAYASFNTGLLVQIDEAYNKSVTARNKEALDERTALLNSYADRTLERIKGLKKAGGLLDDSIIFGSGTLDQILARQDAKTKAEKPKTTGGTPDLSGLKGSTQSETEAIKKFIAVQAEQIEQEKLKLAQYQYTRVEYEKLTEAKKLDLEVTKATANMSAEGAAKYREAAEAVKAQRMALIDLAEAQRQSWSVGAKDALNDYVDSVKDVAGQTKKLFQDAFKGMEDALIGFCKTGQMNFTDLANSIIDDLIRIAIRQSITGPLAGAIGGLFGGGLGGGAGGGSHGFAASPFVFANGGIMTSSGSVPLHKYANGGIANSPQLAMFGEGRTPEAYVPLPDGRNIPVKMQGGGGDTFNISVSVSDGGSQVQGDGGKGKELAKTISGMIQAEIIKQKRSGGALANG